jgi:hypothetical protein
VKAEAYYYKGDFEHALIYFHRGYQMAPEWEQFRLGMQKAREAIHNSVGSPRRFQLSREGDMSYFDQLVLKNKGIPQRISCMSDVEPHDLKVHVAKNPNRARQLMRETFADRVFLEELLADSVTKHGPPEVQSLVVDELRYLSGRAQFWRQQQKIGWRSRVKRERVRSCDIHCSQGLRKLAYQQPV